MAYGGRELAPEEALAAKAAIDTDAIALRNAGAEGSLRELRVRAYLARLQGNRTRSTGTRPARRRPAPPPDPAVAGPPDPVMVIRDGGP